MIANFVRLRSCSMADIIYLSDQARSYVIAARSEVLKAHSGKFEKLLMEETGNLTPVDEAIPTVLLPDSWGLRVGHVQALVEGLHHERYDNSRSCLLFGFLIRSYTALF
jgi:hypothetical protein